MIIHTIEDRYSDKISDRMFQASYQLLEAGHKFTGGTIRALVTEKVFGMDFNIPIIYSDKCSCPVFNKCSRFMDLLTYNN